jgi:EmrB/QacA subfamily drug resistance transporter
MVALSPRRKATILMSCCLSLLIVSMDTTIVNVAIPSIRTELHASAAQMQWVIDIYTLVLASLLILSGATGDRLGRRRVFQVGLVIFAIGSLVCSLAPDVHMLIAARFLQGIGGSMLNPVAMSIISQVFVGRAERARAFGIWGAVMGVAMAVGPMVGGALIELGDWRAVFWVNLPICAAAILLTAVFVPESRSATMRGLDPVGQALAVTFLFAIVFVLIEAPEVGWTATGSLVTSAIALLALSEFLRYEARRRDPFIDLRFFRSIPFASATLMAVCVYAGYGAFLFMMSLYLQGERHYAALHTGLMFLPVSLAMLILSPLSGRLVGRFGSRPSLIIAGTSLTAATLMLAELTVTAPVWVVLGIFALFGAGLAMANSPITTAAVSGMPTDRAGAASAMASTSRQVGVSIGVALCGSLAGSALTARSADYAADARPLWLVCTALGVIITVLAVASTSRRALRSAERVGPQVSGPANPLRATVQPTDCA